MAHADYACCAICDRKMNCCGFDAPTKETICPDCIERTRDVGHICIRPQDVIAHLDMLADEAALAWLHAIGYAPCYYDNELDAYCIKRKLVRTDDPNGAWGKSLQKIY